MANNLLYENIKINYFLLNTWEDKFIPSGIIDNIVYCIPNYYKYLNYVVDLCNSNYENDLDAAIANKGIKKNHIYSGYIYNNINNK